MSNILRLGPTIYKGNTPCNNCPYRKDSKLQLWSKEEFQYLLKMEADQLGGVYHCHKNNGTVCRGWLINQDKRNFPSIMLRVSLSKNNITRAYLDKLTCPVPMFETVEEMCYSNFPELK